MKHRLPTLILSLVAVIATAETPETALLKQRSAEFRKDVIQVADNVYTATGRNYYLTCAQELRKEP